MAGGPEDWHASKDKSDSFHFTKATAGTSNRRTIRWQIFLISLFSLYTVKYKYRWKNEPVNLNSALKNTDTDLQIGMQTHCSSGVTTGMVGTCWSPTIHNLHRCIIKKMVMDLWPAPYQNSNNYWCFTHDQKRSGTNFQQTSVNCTLSTHCYTNGPYKKGNPQTNLRCCFHCPAKLHPKVENQYDVSSHLLTDSKKLLYIIHVTKTGFTYSLIPVSVHQRQILQQLHRTTLTCTTQCLHRCGVKCPLHVLSASLHSRERKIQQTVQCVPSNTAI